MRRRQFINVMAGLVLPAVGSTPTRVGATDVARMQRHTARLRRLDNVMGGGDTYAIYAAEVQRTTRLLDTTQHAEPVRRSLLSLLAEQSQMAGWAAFDAGHQIDARRHYRSSLRAAEDAGDGALAGNALAFAYQQTATNTRGTATAAASYETARAVATPRVAALLLERTAWAHAVAGEARSADDALSLAREALHKDDDRPEPDWVFWVDDTEIDIMAGRCGRGCDGRFERCPCWNVCSPRSTTRTAGTRRST